MAFVVAPRLIADGSAPRGGVCGARRTRQRSAAAGRRGASVCMNADDAEDGADAPPPPASREQERQAAYDHQQEILARRKDKQKTREYFERAQKHRDEIEARIRSRQIQYRDGEDPLVQWKKMQEDGLIKELGYEDVPEGGVQMPMASFGIPKYDQGERFDLRLPYVDRGYEDPNSDVMGKIVSFFTGRRRRGKRAGGGGGEEQPPPTNDNGGSNDAEDERR